MEPTRAERENQRARVLAIAKKDPDLGGALIAARVDVAYGTVMKWLKEAGLKLQTTTERSLAFNSRSRRVARRFGHLRTRAR